MEFSQEPIPARRSDHSISLHGNDTPFRSHHVIRQYVEDLVNRKGYQDFVEYNTTVELVEKDGEEWRLVLRKSGERHDYWWEERFDAVVVANGHFSVPYVPSIRGLEEFAELHPGSVEHSKAYRGREKYRGKVRDLTNSLCHSRLLTTTEGHRSRRFCIGRRRCGGCPRSCAIACVRSRQRSQGKPVFRRRCFRSPWNYQGAFYLTYRLTHQVSVLRGWDTCREHRSHYPGNWLFMVTSVSPQHTNSQQSRAGLVSSHLSPVRPNTSLHWCGSSRADVQGLRMAVSARSKSAGRTSKATPN